MQSYEKNADICKKYHKVMMQVELQTTADGSQTLFVPELDEHYHSVKGALTESLHIFIKMGLLECRVQEPRVLEVGFGTGLNAILTLEASEKSGRKVHYTSLERYPLNLSLIEKLDYPKLLPAGYSAYFLPLHQAAWNEWVEITPCFSLRKMEVDFTQQQFQENYDVIYFDAFAPEKQPEMWSQEIFDKMYACLNEDGILVTYCAKGVIRRMLQAAGFTVERLPGPPGGKREILRARRNKLL